MPSSINIAFKSLFRRPAGLFALLVFCALFFVLFNTPFGQRWIKPQNAQAAPVRGVSGDGWADLIIGKPDFSEVTPYTVVNDILYLPHGVFIDRRNPSDNKMYIFDAGHSRILGFDVEDCLANVTDPLDCQPDMVIGQPDFTTAACNGDSGFQNYPDKSTPTASTLCGVSDETLSIGEGGSGASMDIDSDGNLYFPDFWNHRVLKYIDPFNTDTVADEVWGQVDFTSNRCNKGAVSPSATSLCFSWGSSNNWTAGVDIDSDGNLWVVDSGNNRVLRYPNEGGTISKTADLVLGQSNFTSSSSGSALNKFQDPNAVRVNSSGVVYVSDHVNNRVVKFTSQSTGATGVEFGSGFSSPAGVDFDDTEPGKIWITNQGNNTVELWDETGETLDLTIGSAGDGNLLGDATGSIGFDSAGNMYAAIGIGTYTDSVIEFDKGGSTTAVSNVLFTPGQGGDIDDTGIGTGGGVVVSNNQLIVADGGRVLFWDIPGGVGDLTNGKPADGFIGASSFTTRAGGCCNTMKADESNHLYVGWNSNGDDQFRVEIYDLPLTSGASPISTLVYPLDLLGGGTVDKSGFFNTFSGIAPAPDSSFVWLSDAVDDRVIRVRDPLTTPVVDVILGQPDENSTECNQGGSPGNTTLCNPGALSLDNFGNFYISDHWLENAGNARMIIYDSGTFPTDNVTPIFETEPTKIIDGIAPWESAFDSNNNMVVGFNPFYNLGPNPNGGWFPGIFHDQLGGDTEPDSYLNDYFSMAYAAAFDSADNLYIADLDRARVLVYLSPLTDAVAPILAEVEPVTTPTQDTTPTYVFNSNEPGTISYGGSCTSATNSAAIGDNTITFDTLAEGTYSDCTITVTDFSSNASIPLSVTAFTITAPDATAPTIAEVTAIGSTKDTTPNYTFSSDEDGTISYGGSCNSSGFSPFSLKIYKNGVRVDGVDEITGVFTGPFTGDTPLDIGAQSAGSNGWNGLIDQVKVFDYARLQPQVTIDYNGTSDSLFGAPLDFWKLNEGAGLIAYDTFGGDHGTLYSNPVWQPAIDCISGTCLSFSDGAYVTTPSRPGPSSSATFEAWVNPTDTSGDEIIISKYTGTDAYMQLFTQGSNIVFRIHQVIDTIFIGRIAESMLEANTWQQIIAVWDGGKGAENNLNNVVTFDTLPEGTYSDCTMTVTDLYGNTSNVLDVSPFTIDTTVPTLTEVTPVGTTSDTTPNYTFNSSEDGTASYGGSCTSADTSISTGDNTITFSTLTPGTYSDCTITVTDAATNSSSALNVSSFTITSGSDATPPSKPGRPSTDTPTNDDTPRWTWGDSTDNVGVDHYEIQWCKDVDFDGCSDNTDTKTNNSFTHEDGLSDGTWYLRVRAVDASDNESDWSSSGRVEVDTQEPEIDNADTTPDTTSIEVTWDTNEDATTEIEWGTTTSYGNSSSDSSLTQSHSKTLTGLTPGTRYYIKLSAEDEAGNRSADVTLVETTLPAGGGTTPPVTPPTEPPTTPPTTPPGTTPPGTTPPGTTPVTEPPTETPPEETNIGDIVVPEIIKDILKSEVVTRSIETIQEVSETPVAKATSATIALAPTITLIATGVPTAISLIPYLSLSQLPGLIAGLIRKKRHPWGVAFDSNTKQPLDPVVLTLKDENGKEVSQTISDLYGRYEFLISEGNYFLEAQKTDYAFPSAKYKGIKSDEIYEDIYLGEKVQVSKGGKVAFNIPMDPINVDFNEAAKATQYGVKGVGKFTKIILKVSGILFKVGFVYSAIVMLVSFNTLNFIIFGLYTLLGSYRLYRSKTHSWGTILDKTNSPVPDAVVRLINVKIPQFKITPVVTDQTGRYIYLMDKGTYKVQVQTKDSAQNTYVNRYTSEPITVEKEFGSIAEDVKLN